ncbi:uncharacterized protein C5orf34 homolog isoform X1 [Myxocyprinus asiaticus]|uniref:uncharacterized protein C5orf34 homolog isoform X1 n=1 Tax=Myxocyprinus asiaticus TaxID=70543 RepID=UPI0022237C3D|nr:uncharacterized protein C5orf34 homolog isoform X1 [Myxocyprinus asiaticus]
MCAVRFIVMYVDDSVDVYYTDGRRLQLSPCGSEFIIEKHISPTAHPLQARERVRQRTRFAISEYKVLVFNALEFRNKYATHPYLPEELITVEFTKAFTDAVTEVKWPASDSCSVTCGPHGEITVCSVDGHAKLILSSSGEEFTIEFICRSSQSQAVSQYLQPQGNQQKNTRLLSSPSSKSSLAKDINFSKASAGAQVDLLGTDVKSPDTVESTSTVSRKLHQYTRVIQQYSRALYPQTWHYPLSLAVRYWESHKIQINAVTGQNKIRNIDGEDKKSHKLPDPLPLKCPSPHQHRWRYDDVNPDLLEQMERVTAELVKVVWCKGIIYRIIDGVIAVVEISPGDGSVIRSSGVLANYFTHYKAGAAQRDAVECVYYLCGLPPDISGQMYSVRSVITRASRILKCYIQAKTSLRAPVSFYCWKEQAAVCESVSVVQEVTVAGTGYFKALSDGTAEVLFLDGVRAQMTWKSNMCTPVQVQHSYHCIMEQRHMAEARPSQRWCQLNLPDGHQTLVQVETDKTYQRYVSAVVEWCDWIKQTEQSTSAEGVVLSNSAHSNMHQPITCRSVVSELEKIKRFNFLLENSPVLRSTGKSLSCEHSSDHSHHPLTDNCISEALQKTSKAIQDINTLLSERP